MLIFVKTLIRSLSYQKRSKYNYFLNHNYIYKTNAESKSIAKRRTTTISK